MNEERWLACLWDEVKAELESLGLEYTVQRTGPRGRILPAGAVRVVRVRRKQGLEFVVARTAEDRAEDGAPGFAD
ncbi:Hypothetical protein DEACI_3230 [Acididesulfobacillus acetoxydans]|uniref:Uncharacterized protein n=1 Tax=Acididesulfobacillus acetoxydans TaxID=1561005 RepID=A0A8S0X0F7_9FIRM|nr:hypothetical protein [Acididesulfobacillus acetoxydans]CAA7602551.1 Hypothetical protein DEACI_3230 [Acididesulfobacillus acetoxydans]CEJ07303.1 Hypothetical protein DEACI_1764 [Acididesulfobacillus acetoxydans]